MGLLHYDSRTFPMTDRLLAHLQVVISMKLRRSESFFLTWRNEPAGTSGRNSLWIDNGVPIFCEFESSEIPLINRAWIDTLTQSAGTNFGLQITAEGTLEPFALDSPSTSEQAEA